MVTLTGPSGGELLGENLNFQFAMLVLVTLIVYVWRGGGRFSLDRMMSGEEGQPAPRAQA